MKYYVMSRQMAFKGDSGESYGSTYDLSNACKACGTGARLVGKLYTKGLKNVDGDYLYTLAGDNLVSKKLYEALVKNDAILNDVSIVLDSKNRDTSFFYLNPRFSFPKMLPCSEGLVISDQCPICKQNGFFNHVIAGSLEKGISTYVTPFKFYYSGIDNDFLDQSDIFHTWECMGLSNIKAEGNRVVRYARPLLIVSDKVKEVLEQFKIRKILFDEILIYNGPVELQ